MDWYWSGSILKLSCDSCGRSVTESSGSSCSGCPYARTVSIGTHTMIFPTTWYCAGMARSSARYG
ncbi:hypothetical protein VL04_12120 [Chromobacterium violaceum]|nr:hypothetical protein UF16_14960 [Chromobacterium violaceum]KMN48059.1 hypothetical protein VK93_17540 [Chromobacterium violaceum]KMN86451.1 hypothetical protein VL02_08545 [Chromobacterium violaceum]KMN89933.1 hypothetical protein VL04_12120 [Chromobacterium violaceum]KMO02153.1 hypothetical protein VL16_20755 [Chromobacterium violaceum]